MIAAPVRVSGIPSLISTTLRRPFLRTVVTSIDIQPGQLAGEVVYTIEVRKSRDHSFSGRLLPDIGALPQHVRDHLATVLFAEKARVTGLFSKRQRQELEDLAAAGESA